MKSNFVFFRTRQTTYISIEKKKEAFSGLFFVDFSVDGAYERKNRPYGRKNCPYGTTFFVGFCSEKASLRRSQAAFKTQYRPRRTFLDYFRPFFVRQTADFEQFISYKALSFAACRTSRGPSAVPLNGCHAHRAHGHRLRHWPNVPRRSWQKDECPKNQDWHTYKYSHDARPSRRPRRRPLRANR